MNNVDFETRRNLVIEAWTVTGGKFTDMQMRKVALRAGEKLRQKQETSRNEDEQG
jgi:hypothetical protein